MINSIYQNALKIILDSGDDIQGRNGLTKNSSTLTMKFTELPLISVRKTAWRLSLHEMEWFLSGSTGLADLHKTAQKWWKPWADSEGQLPYTYGKQFRYSQGCSGDVDQLRYLIDNVKKDPFSRRHVISLWNTEEMQLTPLPCCHGSLITVNVSSDKKINLTMVQRSADMIIGLPHNLVQYWAFLMYLARMTELEIGSFTWIGLNCHIYESHLAVAREIVNTEVDAALASPKLVYNPTSTDFKALDFILDTGYKFMLNPKLDMVV
jgi:thymidylate synthase